MKNILITGGLGYLGGRIANYLKENAPEANISLTEINKNRKFPKWTRQFTVLQMDLLDEKSIKKCMKDIDLIIHLAAMNEIDSIKDPGLALKVNTEGSYKLLESARRNNIERFIYFSTFHVYGKTSETMITEETPTKPFHPYSLTHRAAEDFVTFFNHYYNMKTLIFRLSNGYGYPMDKEIDRWTLVFNDLCRQAVTTGKIILKSSGTQSRDFISLHDIARAVHYFVFVKPNNWGDGLYNLGGECPMSILEVAERISEIYKKKYKKKLDGIEIQTEQNDSSCVLPVKYNIEKLKKTEFYLEGDMDHEIEKTLSLCEGFIG